MENKETGQAPQAQPGVGQDAGVTPAQPQKYEIDYNGQKISATADEIGQWKSGHMMQADYTKKTQELSEQRRNFEAQVIEEATKLFMEAQEAEKAKAIPAAQPQNGAQPKPGETRDEYRERIERLENEFKSQKEQSESAKYEQQLKSVEVSMKEKYPNMNWREVMLDFYQNSDPRADPSVEFERLAKASHEGRLSEKQKIIDEYVNSKKSPANRGELGAGGTPVNGAKAPPKNFAEARARAEELMANSR